MSRIKGCKINDFTFQILPHFEIRFNPALNPSQEIPYLKSLSSKARNFLLLPSLGKRFMGMGRITLQS
jgi:hypothetical protein